VIHVQLHCRIFIIVDHYLLLKNIERENNCRFFDNEYNKVCVYLLSFIAYWSDSPEIFCGLKLWPHNNSSVIIQDWCKTVFYSFYVIFTAIKFTI